MPLLAAVPLAGVPLAYWYGVSGGLLSLVLLLGVPLYVARNIRTQAEERVREIRSLLPHTLDLMALVLEAGSGTLFDCLEFGARENAGNPLGDELRRAVRAIAQGGQAQNVLAEMGRRLGDPDVVEVNLAIATSETQGIPLKESLKTVAARLRTRQVQWLEQASERAKVHITWPVMTVMVACLAIIVAPILMAGMSAGGDLIP
jgi:Flp pilus assembly protein TadB